MAVLDTDGALSVEDYAQAMADYIREGTQRAHDIGNRGPIKLDANGKLEADILEAYWTHGFSVFENVVRTEELAALRADVERMLAQAPTDPKGETDSQGQPAFGKEFTRPCDLPANVAPGPI